MNRKDEGVMIILTEPVDLLNRPVPVPNKIFGPFDFVECFYAKLTLKREGRRAKILTLTSLNWAKYNGIQYKRWAMSANTPESSIIADTFHQNLADKDLI